MPIRHISVSIDCELHDRIDGDPETRERGRSAFFWSAAEFYLATRKAHTIDEDIRRAYAGQADAMVDEIANLLEKREESQP